VVGIMYQKFRFLKKFINPLEMIGQFAPLISISFRMFGNMIGGSTLMYLVYAFASYIWQNVPGVGQFNLLGSLIAPPLHFYFDLFDGLIQGFVFTLLTLVYWSLETEGH
jgi:F-type H+-transporting ATPase subunit a